MMNSDKLDDQEKTKRIKILGREELSALYDLPQFSEDEQKHFFSLSPEEKLSLKTFHALSSRIYFILQLGYFKSHQMFFAFNYKKMIRDIRYIKKKHFSQSPYNKFKISKNTQFKQQRLVVEFSGAAAVAALRTSRVGTEGKGVVVVVSGGNVDPAVLVDL